MRKSGKLFWDFMPNLIVGLVATLSFVDFAHAYDIILRGTVCGYTTGTYPDANGVYYYKCNSTYDVSSCISSPAAKISYSSKSGGNGTQNSPYILTGCKFVSSLCDATTKYVSSSNSCVKCDTGSEGSLAVPASYTGDNLYHKETKCSYCEKGYYKKNVYVGVYACFQCPDGGTSDGTSDVTSCHLEAGWTDSDSTGEFTCDSDGYYSN